jgi:hypothetical protein
MIMGGNALKHLNVKRKTLQEYNEIKKEVLEIIKEYYEKVAVPQEVPDKESFGDLDVLVSQPLPDKSLPENDPRFFSRGHVRCGSVTSFEYKDFQIDLINVSPNCFELSNLYFIGDIGCILGIIATFLGLKFGFDSLAIRYKCKEGSKFFHLTSDVEKILEFFGLPYPPEQGFQSRIEMFEWIAKTRFDILLFKQTRRNYRVKHRLSTRPFFTSFFEWVEKFPGEAPEINKIEMQEEAASFFGKQEEFLTFKNKIQTEERLREVFNGRMVNELTGLHGCELGTFIRSFKERYTPEEIIRLGDDGTLDKTILTQHIAIQ